VLADLREPLDIFDYQKWIFPKSGRSPAATAVKPNHRVGESIDQALIDPELSTHLYGFA
jgi:hypothetical protein